MQTNPWRNGLPPVHLARVGARTGELVIASGPAFRAFTRLAGRRWNGSGAAISDITITRSRQQSRWTSYGVQSASCSYSPAVSSCNERGCRPKQECHSNHAGDNHVADMVELPG